MPVRGKKYSIWILTVVVTVPVLVTLLTAGRSGLYDDLLVLRTSALLSPVAEDVSPVLLEHLSRYEDDLAPGQWLRYSARVDTLINYPANSILVRLMENLPSFSIYQSNILSHSILKLLAMLVLVLVATRTLGSPTLLFLVLMSSLIIGTLPQGHLLNPLGRSGFLWYQAPLRCTAIVWFMALLLHLGTMGGRDPGRNSWFLAGVLALMGISMNVGLACVYLPPLLLVCVLRSLIFSDGESQPAPLPMCAVFIGAVCLACAGWWAFITISGGSFRFGSQRWFVFFYWLVCSLISIVIWQRVRPEVERRNVTRRRLGDFLLVLMLIFAIVVLGLNWIQADRTWMASSLFSFVLVELGTRATGPANAVFLLLGTVTLPYMGLGRLRRYVTPAACAVLVLMPIKYGVVAYDNWDETMDRRLRILRLDDLGHGSAVYRREKDFYAAVSNELKLDPTGSTVRKYFGRDD